MRSCISCEGIYDAGTCCKQCHEDLKAKVAFLTMSQPAFFSDVILFASNDENPVPIPAHKAVLIGDVSYDALRAFINYLYTAEVCLDQQLACDLLVMAEKYQVQHLKDLCQKFLVANLNWDNEFMIYTFAHQHDAKQIIDAALALITNKMHKLSARKEYEELKERDPRLIFEINEAYFSKQATNYIFSNYFEQVTTCDTLVRYP